RHLPARGPALWRSSTPSATASPSPAARPATGNRPESTTETTAMGRRSPAGRRGQPIGGLAALASLREALAEQARRARQAEKQAREAAQRAEREANLFRVEMADATPLRATGRVELRPAAPAALPIQRMRDEQAVLEESLSDEIDIERYLETDETLSWRRAGIGPDVV